MEKMYQPVSSSHGFTSKTKLDLAMTVGSTKKQQCELYKFWDFIKVIKQQNNKTNGPSPAILPSKLKCKN